MARFAVTVVHPDGFSFEVHCDGTIECSDVILAESRRSNPMTLFVIHEEAAGSRSVVGRWALNSAGRLVSGKMTKRRSGGR